MLQWNYYIQIYKHLPAFIYDSVTRSRWVPGDGDDFFCYSNLSLWERLRHYAHHHNMMNHVNKMFRNKSLRIDDDTNLIVGEIDFDDLHKEDSK